MTYSVDSKSNLSDESTDGSHYIVLENIAETAHVWHMSLKLLMSFCRAVNLGHIIHWSTTLADGRADLLSFLIIHCFFLWPAALLFNAHDSMFYRLIYLMQIVRLMAALPERTVHCFHLSNFHSVALLWHKHSYLPLMDTLTGYYFLECYFNLLSDLRGVIFTLITASHLTLLCNNSTFSPAPYTFLLYITLAAVKRAQTNARLL